MKLYTFQLVCLIGCSCLCLCRASQTVDNKQQASVSDFYKHGRPASRVNLVASSESKDDSSQQTRLGDKWRGEQQRNLQGKEVANDGNGSTTDGTKFYEQPWFDGVIVGAILIVIIIVIVIVASIIACCCYNRCKRNRERTGAITDSDPKYVEFENSNEWSGDSRETSQYHRVQRSKRLLGDSDEDAAVQFFLNANYQFYKFDEKLEDLGSRVQKCWYVVKSMKDEEMDFMMLTVAPVSGSCPLQLHKYQKGLNKLLAAVKVHPFIHPIERVDYLVDHKLLVVIQPQRFEGSLKDLIYQVSYPTLDWSQKYARRSRGLPPAKVARYGRQILEAVTFLYSKRFPTLGHIQSGNIFIVDDVCCLGGYENTLVGYKTRLFMRCRDQLQKLDAILFGHLIFEMSAGYELTELRPAAGEYRAVHKAVRPILEYIFEEGFPHGISEIMALDFFQAVPLPELKDFDPNTVQLTDSMNKVLAKVRKNKPRVQKMPNRQPRTKGYVDGEGGVQVSTSWKDRLHVPKQIQQLFGQTNKREKFPGGLGLSPETRQPLLSDTERSSIN